MLRCYADGRYYPTVFRMYNVQCWYTDTACEIFQIRAHDKNDAIERAMMLAKQKGYMEKYPYTRFASAYVL